MNGATIKLPSLEYNLLQEIIDFFKPDEDDQIWLVGGSVRDLIDGADSVPDLDLALSFDPLPSAREYARRKKTGFVVLDEERQVVRIVKTTENGHFNIDLAGFRAADIDADLRGRDFTFNAIAARIKFPLKTNVLEIYDPLDGVSHLRLRQLEACSEAVFTDDPLRLMRAFRFAARFDGHFSEALAAKISSQAHLLQQVSGERIRDEFFKVLSVRNSAVWIERMQQCGILRTFLNELADCSGVEQNEWHHLDVFDHSLLTLKKLEHLLCTGINAEWWPQILNYLNEPISAGRTYLQALKFGCLLHDIGKPGCKSERSDDRRVIFHGHEMHGARLCRDVCERLRLSVNELHYLQKLVKNHMRPGVIQQQGVSDKRLFKYYSETGRDGVGIALLSLADRLSAQGSLSEEDIASFSNGITAIIDGFYQQLKKPKKPPLLTGADLIAEFALKPGPLFRNLLEAIAEAQYTGEIVCRDEALQLVHRLLEKTN